MGWTTNFVSHSDCTQKIWYIIDDEGDLTVAQHKRTIKNASSHPAIPTIQVIRIKRITPKIFCIVGRYTPRSVPILAAYKKPSIHIIKFWLKHVQFQRCKSPNANTRLEKFTCHTRVLQRVVWERVCWLHNFAETKDLSDEKPINLCREIHWASELRVASPLLAILNLETNKN